MITFEKITKYQEDENVKLPGRKTVASAGYDFYAAEDIVIPSYFESYIRFYNNSFKAHFSTTDEMDKITHPITLSDLAKLTKEYGFKPTLVPTGTKCKMPDDLYLQLSVRSSLPLKHWLILANGVGVIDAEMILNDTNLSHL